MSQRTILTAISYFSLGLLTVTGGFAQSSPDDAQQPHAWRRADAPQDQAQQAPNQDPPPPPPNFTANQGAGQPPAQPNAPAPVTPQNIAPPPQYQPNDIVPARLTIKPGTFVTVRVN